MGLFFFPPKHAASVYYCKNKVFSVKIQVINESSLCLMDLLNYFLFTITLLFAVLRTTLYGFTVSGPRLCCYDIYVSAKPDPREKEQNAGLQILLKG